MKNCKVRITGTTPYSQSKHYVVQKEKRETSADYETRTWRERMHVDENGIVFVPRMAFKNLLSDAAKYLSMQIPGKGKATYTKHFEAGISVENDMSLGVKKDDVVGEWVFVPADGRRGGSKRVSKCFPKFEKWGGIVDFVILDDAVTKDVFEYHIKEAGRFIGIGRFRPRNNGYYGRFAAEVIEWEEIER